MAVPLTPETIGEVTTRLLLDCKHASKEGKPVMILVVEDHVSTAEMQRIYFRQLGCRVELVHDGNDAVRLIERGFKPDLIFLDLKLPGMDGSSVLWHIRKHIPKVPVVIVTGHPESDIMRRCMDLGYVGLVTKPLGLESITEVLEKHGLKK